MPALFVGAGNSLHSLMKTDQVDTAVDPLKQTQQLSRMTGRIVLPCPTDIFETHPPLVRPVIIPEQRNHIGNGHHLLRRHNQRALYAEGVMHRHRYMTLALVQEALHGRNTYRGDGNPFR